MHMSMEIHWRSSQQRILTCLRKNEIKIESWVVLISKLQCLYEKVINGPLIMPDFNSLLFYDCRNHQGQESQGPLYFLGKYS